MCRIVDSYTPAWIEFCHNYSTYFTTGQCCTVDWIIFTCLAWVGWFVLPTVCHSVCRVGNDHWFQQNLFLLGLLQMYCTLKYCENYGQLALWNFHVSFTRAKITKKYKGYSIVVMSQITHTEIYHSEIDISFKYPKLPNMTYYWHDICP